MVRGYGIVFFCIFHTLYAQEESIKALTPMRKEQHVINLEKMPDPFSEFNLTVADPENEFEKIVHFLFHHEGVGDFYGLKQNEEYIELTLDDQPGMLFCGANYFPIYSMMAYAPMILADDQVATTTWANMISFYGPGSRGACMDMIDFIQRAYLNREMCDKIIITSEILNQMKQPLEVDGSELERTFVYEKYLYHELKCTS